MWLFVGLRASLLAVWLGGCEFFFFFSFFFYLFVVCFVGVGEGGVRMAHGGYFYMR